MKNLKTLVQDIYDLFIKDDVKFSEEETKEFGEKLAKHITNRITDERGSFTLRMSNLGQPDRKLWYQAKGVEGEPLPPEARVKFLFGDILEELLLFLAKKAGHSVEGTQDEMDIDGVKGHRDAVIDGVLVDVKSASTYSYNKMIKEGLTKSNDNFGYLSQLSSYIEASKNDPLVKEKDKGVLFVIDKTLGHIGVREYNKDKMDMSKLIEHKREVINSDEEPPKCYPDEPQQKSGNRQLGVQCSYCPFKFHCWRDSNDGFGLRTFIYSGKPVYLTKVVREPRVFEVK